MGKERRKEGKREREKERKRERKREKEREQEREKEREKERKRYYNTNRWVFFSEICHNEILIPIQSFLFHFH